MSFPEIPQLTAANARGLLPAVEAALARMGTLELTPLASGVYPASGGEAAGGPSGYQHAWLRDNAMVAYSRWHCGDPHSALRTLRSLGAFLSTQLPRMKAIIARPGLKEEPGCRPHVRFEARTLAGLDADWPHAQNDALAHVMWLRLRLAGEERLELDPAEQDLYATLARYFGAIEYWKDADSGAWEESREVRCSSIGAVVAALTAMKRLRGPGDLDTWIRAGKEALAARLPFEAPPARKTDAALLLLIHPLDVLQDRCLERRIVSLVRARLLGPAGVRRYVGDSYFCQDYDEWFPPEERSADFSENLELRDEFLQPGCEAQWCLFDPILSAIHGRWFRQDRSRTDLLEAQLHYFNRALAQLTPQGQCPELYFLKRGAWVPNGHTPLAWTQANLAVALHSVKASLAPAS